MRNLGEYDVNGTDDGNLASATIGGTECQAPVSGPAPVTATVGAEVVVSIEGADPEAQTITLQLTFPSGVTTDGTEAKVRALREEVDMVAGVDWVGMGYLLDALGRTVARTRLSRGLTIRGGVGVWMRTSMS